MESVNTACKLFEEGRNCSQSLLCSFSPDFGLDAETALKVSRAFGGGMGHMGETCGALTGAFMVLSLQYDIADVQARDRLYAQVRDLANQFKALHGSILCRDLIDCDLSTTEGEIAFKEKNLRKSHCPAFVRDAAQITRQILDQSTSKLNDR